jgi:hypothetical protein
MSCRTSSSAVQPSKTSFDDKIRILHAIKQIWD